MSKYERLGQSLPCLWLKDSTGSVCGERFTDMRLFSNHVRSQHISSNSSSSVGHSLKEEWESGANYNQGVLCGWVGCEQVILGTYRDYIIHSLFHPYHCFLKLLGLEFQEKTKLPNCRYNSNFSNIVQLSEVEPKCLWDRGQCQQVFDNVWEFYSHVRNHIKTGAVENKCQWQDCSFSGRDRNKVLEHCRTHLQEKPIACTTCGMRFSNNTKLKDHLNRQMNPTGDPDLTCSFCHKCFPNARLLREHRRRHINSIKCPHCDLTCQGPSRLFQHIRYRHVSCKSHQCPLCNKTYKTVQSLTMHIETHGSYRAKCNWPNCKFLAKSERLLQTHERAVHHMMVSAKLYCCHVCDSRYLQGRQLTSHLKTEHGFELPPGHCRFRYIMGKDGLKRLQTVRLDVENLYTPELDTFTTTTTVTASSDSSVTIKPHRHSSDQELSSDNDQDQNELEPAQYNFEVDSNDLENFTDGLEQHGNKQSTSHSLACSDESFSITDLVEFGSFSPVLEYALPGMGGISGAFIGGGSTPGRNSGNSSVIDSHLSLPGLNSGVRYS